MNLEAIKTRSKGVKNRYNLDVAYFRRELKVLSDSLEDRTPEELSRYLRRLAETAHPKKSAKSQ